MPKLPRLTLPSRYRVLAWAAVIFVLINTGLRLGLLFWEAEVSNFLPWNVLPILAVGFGYDLITAAFLMISFASLALLLPNGPRARKAHGVVAAAFMIILIFVSLFTATAEALFWNEFSSRFNFIAVDYLVYTRETVGNIQESYPLGLLLAAVAASTAGIFFAIRRPFWNAATADGGSWSRRFAASAVIVALPIAAVSALGDPRELLPTTSARELASNGYYELVRAFRSNELDFYEFYSTISPTRAKAEMREEFEEAQSPAVFTNGQHPLERKVTSGALASHLNIVLVTMESFGAEFVESLHGKKGLSPNLDRLGREGLLFTQLYATGTRTVRGLEAISLSLPPTPGHAVLTRQHNKGFQTLGGILRNEGYEPVFIYGGYGYFDNMQDFFGGNGYTVVDRTSLASKDISHETIWGVADEDLFKMVLREVDSRAAAGKKIFAHVMTTSNHRPFTYPDGRIDIPSGSGRAGAVKYSDWAIGNFMREAATRPWFNDTVFIFVADHTSQARGRTDLPLENYRIPLIIYSPEHVTPARVDALASQIDIGPTLLALLNISYTSQFFGQDILTEGQHHQRALMANYLTVGHVEDGVLVELGPKHRNRILDARTGRVLAADDPRAPPSLVETIAYFQVATDVLHAH